MTFTLVAKCRCFSSEKVRSSRNTNQGFLPVALPLPDTTCFIFKVFLPLDQGFLSARLLQQTGSVPTIRHGSGPGGTERDGEGTELSVSVPGRCHWSGDRELRAAARCPSLQIARECRCMSNWSGLGCTDPCVNAFCSLFLAHQHYPKIVYSTFFFLFFSFYHPLPNKLFLGTLSQAVNLLWGCLNYSYPQR